MCVGHVLGVSLATGLAETRLQSFVEGKIAVALQTTRAAVGYTRHSLHMGKMCAVHLSTIHFLCCKVTKGENLNTTIRFSSTFVKQSQN